MLIRMPRVGNGAADNPYRVLMPTWTHITDTPNGQASIVAIPDDDAPDDLDAPDTPRRPLVSGVPVLVGLTPLQRARWHIKLARRWHAVMADPTPDVL